MLPEDNHALALFMLYPEVTDESPPPAGDLFPEHLPVLFLEGMTYLHTAITPNLDIIDLVCFAYPSDITMHVTEEQLGQLFTTLVHLHYIADTLTRAMLESATTYVPPLGFLWLIRVWQNAWDIQYLMRIIQLAHRARG